MPAAPVWIVHSDHLPDTRGHRYTVDFDGRPMTVAGAIRAWQDDPGFRWIMNTHLAAAAYPAFRWETPAVTASTLDRPFEFVILDSPYLEREPDPAAFDEHFTDPASEIVTFANLGRDAVLVVPCPAGEPSAYGHLAAFVRHAPEAQRHALWRAVGAAMARRVGAKPVWLSTAGAGVPWLHVRLDDRPKYYAHAPYR
jgi:hypothetical protein